MEYERALFRVYDRSLESLRADQPCFENRCRNRFRPTSVCACVEVFLVSLIGLCVILLGVAHTNFVGNAGDGLYNPFFDNNNCLARLDS